MLGEQQEVEQTLLVNDAKRLKGDEPANAKVAIGDINQGKPTAVGHLGRGCERLASRSAVERRW